MEAILQAMAALVLHTQVARGQPQGGTAARPQATTNVNGTVGLIVLDSRDMRRSGVRRPRGVHAAAAVSDLGDVVGQVIKRNGRAICGFAGVTDGSCVVLSGCGVSSVACL